MKAIGVVSKECKIFRKMNVFKNSLRNLLVRNTMLADLFCQKMIVDKREHIKLTFSQYGQDVVIRNLIKLLPIKEKYFFIDVGAHDGVTFSNSMFLDEIKNWSGVLLEPNPEVFKSLVSNRPGQVCIEAAVAEEEGVAEFMKNSGYTEMLSSLKNEVTFRHRKRIVKEQQKYYGKTENITVQTRKLENICVENNLSSIDLLLIDVEGGEYGALKSLDFSKVEVSIILVERNFNSSKVKKFLEDRNFIRLFSVGSDDFYISRHLCTNSN